MSYIISNDQLVAITTETLPSGTDVLFAHETCAEQVNAQRDVNLVSARPGKISNAKKWAKYASEVEFATQINPGEFLI